MSQTATMAVDGLVRMVKPWQDGDEESDALHSIGSIHHHHL